VQKLIVIKIFKENRDIAISCSYLFSQISYLYDVTIVEENCFKCAVLEARFDSLRSVSTIHRHSICSYFLNAVKRRGRPRHPAA